jgi:L-ascorbate metabolism protein UlaG (beta-lactamase superfamily)
MRRSPQWDESAFTNASIRSLDFPSGPMPLGEFFCPRERRAPLEPLPSVDPTGVWRRPAETGLRVTWLGHSTVLLEVGGRRILTDPVWGKRASPARGIGPKRFQPVPVPLADLPPPDLVVVSHDHYDHLDYPTIRILAGTSVPFVTALGVGAHLEAWGVSADRITELDWWEHASFFDGEVSVTATPAQHFSGRSPTTRNHSLWSSFVVDAGGRTVYFGGDSGWHTGFTEVGERFRPFDLVLLEIGAYHPAWANVHLGPVNALSALAALGGGPLLPIHWGTFDLATHRWDQPIEMLTNGAADDVQVLTPRLGEPAEPGLAAHRGERWWQDVARTHQPDPAVPADETVAPPPPSD